MLRWCAGARTVAPAPTRRTPALPQAPRATRVSRRRHRRLLRPCSAKKPANNEEQAGGGSVLSKSVLLRSKDTEDLLKLGAYVVVPLSLALMFSVSEDSKES